VKDHNWKFLKKLVINNFMRYCKTELEEAKFAIDSTISKCEKSLQKIKEKSPQRTLLIRRIKALKLSIYLIDRELLIQDKKNEKTCVAK
jgi:hypothetical protein